MSPKRLSDAEAERRFWRLPHLCELSHGQKDYRGRWMVRIWISLAAPAASVVRGRTRAQAIRRAMAELDRRQGK